MSETLKLPQSRLKSFSIWLAVLVINIARQLFNGGKPTKFKHGDWFIKKCNVLQQFTRTSDYSHMNPSLSRLLIQISGL